MNKGDKRAQTASVMKNTPGKIRPGIGRPEMDMPGPVHPTRKKSWSDKQWQQSQKFWEKKNQRVESHYKSLHQRTLNSEKKFIDSQRGVRNAELQQLSQMKLVSSARQNQMPNATTSVLPDRAATKGYKDVVGHIGDFLEKGAEVRSTFNAGGPQLIQQFTDSQNRNVTRRVGVDVEDSSHVRGLNPHLNLQTQFGGKIQGGTLADPHHPVQSFDPFRTLRPNPNGPHPLQGALTSDEKRAFMERYVRSLGTPVKRQ